MHCACAWTDIRTLHTVRTTTTTTTTKRLGSQVLRASVIFVARASLLVSSGGSAVRRRERRLRGFWRHEQLSIKMALASATHHSWQSRASVGVGAEVDVPVSVGVRSEVLTEPWPQERIQRRTVEHLAVLAPPVQILDVPLPQVVDQPMDVLTRFDIPVPEQVIEVPKISCPSRPLRAVLREPQTAEQLVDVPTVVSFSSLQQQTAEQLVVLPVSRRDDGGRLPGFHPGQFSVQCSAEQNIDTSVLGRGVSGGLQGPHPGPASEQRSVEQNADIPVPRRRDKRSVEQNADFPVRRGDMRSVEQNADIPVLRRGDERSVEQNAHIPIPRRGDSGGLHGSSLGGACFVPGQSSAAHRGADFRPRCVCTRFLERQWGGRGCAYGDGCTFAHSWAELHPEASAHERELASYFDA